MNRDGIIIEPDRDNSDYIYRVSDLVLLKGKTYDGKRNLIRKFKSNNDYEYVKLNESNIRECLGFEDNWCIAKDCDNVKSLDNERTALRDMVESFSAFGLKGGAIKVDGTARAFAIGERLNSDTFVMHMLKAEASKNGLYQTMLRDFLEIEAGRFEYVNLEQDLGVAGLRRSKVSYGPCRMLNKYTVRIGSGEA